VTVPEWREWLLGIRSAAPGPPRGHDGTQHMDMGSRTCRRQACLRDMLPCVHGMYFACVHVYFACVHVYTHVLYVHAPAHMPQASPTGQKQAEYEKDMRRFLRARNARELLESTGFVIIETNMTPECLVQFRRLLAEEVCQSAPCPAYTHAPTHLTHMHS